MGLLFFIAMGYELMQTGDDVYIERSGLLTTQRRRSDLSKSDFQRLNSSACAAFVQVR